eukprot:TRINITY_DN1592_c0_g1_i8.p1 TRINITY_DN1592_c0_g1~~TRINITY_DN1592_c0_g1_i8.p1  ORF type:complete len:498 (+),score=70.20 TRINITY_DN1592_c0_g1_i8:339-1832(+)
MIKRIHIIILKKKGINNTNDNNSIDNDTEESEEFEENEEGFEENEDEFDYKTCKIDLSIINNIEFEHHNHEMKNIHYMIPSDHNERIKNIIRCPAVCNDHDTKEECKRIYITEANLICREECDCNSKCACGWKHDQTNPYYHSKEKRIKAVRIHLRRAHTIYLNSKNRKRFKNKEGVFPTIRMKIKGGFCIIKHSLPPLENYPNRSNRTNNILSETTSNILENNTINNNNISIISENSRIDIIESNSIPVYNPENGGVENAFVDKNFYISDPNKNGNARKRKKSKKRKNTDDSENEQFCRCLPSTVNSCKSCVCYMKGRICDVNCGCDPIKCKSKEKEHWSNDSFFSPRKLNIHPTNPLIHFNNNFEILFYFLNNDFKDLLVGKWNADQEKQINKVTNDMLHCFFVVHLSMYSHPFIKLKDYWARDSPIVTNNIIDKLITPDGKVLSVLMHDKKKCFFLTNYIGAEPTKQNRRYIPSVNDYYNFKMLNIDKFDDFIA